MACRINSLLAYPSDAPLFSPLCYSQNQFPHTYNLHLPPSLDFNLKPKQILYTNCRRRGSLLVVKSQTMTEEKPISDDRMLVYVPPHPFDQALGFGFEK